MNSQRATARPASVFRWWLLNMPGKAALFNASAYLSKEAIIPRWGPKRVLWVLIVMQSAPSRSGSWNKPAPIRPETCAASYATLAPCSLATSDSSFTGLGKRNRLPPKRKRSMCLPSFSSRLIFFSDRSTSMLYFSSSNSQYCTFRPWTAPAVPPIPFLA